MKKNLRELKKSLDKFVSDYHEEVSYGGFNIGASSKADLDREIARRILIALEKKKAKKLEEKKKESENQER